MVSTSDTALKVTGSDVTVYGLMGEHTRNNTVDWHGENGQVFMFQCELPYTPSVRGVDLWYPGSKAY